MIPSAHRLAETEGRVERFVLSLIEEPGVLREKVEEQAERERRALRHTDREARRIRQRLDKLEIMEDGYHDQAAEGLMSLDRLRGKLSAVANERAALEGRLAGLADGEERIGWLERLPALVEEYLRDLPHLVGRETAVREYETAPPEKTEGNPLGLYLLTRDSIRRLDGEKFEEKQRAAEAERSQRFR